jgi:ABC-type nitrate/sulfonate/bicarbonate transport system permease component
VVWQLASTRFPDYLLPGVAETLSATWHLLLDFPDEIGLTLARLLGAIGLAMLGGWAIGLLMSIRLLGPMVEPFLKIASAIPFGSCSRSCGCPTSRSASCSSSSCSSCRSTR